MTTSSELRWEGVHKKYSTLGGIKLFVYLIEQLQIADRIALHLPVKKRKCGISSLNKFLILLYSLICGADCIDDIEWMKKDPLFAAITNGGMAAITAGDFLRSFLNLSLEGLKNELLKVAINMRESIFPNDKEIILMMDSTPHEHFGKKFEGINWNYKKMWCLDSLNCYDQYGFHYDFELRAGNTYSSEGAELMIRKFFKNVSYEFKKFFRADSAFSRLTIYNELINASVKFAIALKANVYKSILEKNKNLIKWNEKNIEFFGSSTCEIGNALYPLQGLAGGLSHLKVIFIRVKKRNTTFKIDEENLVEDYYYYALVTNIFKHEKSEEKVLEFYRGRSNGENFIREEKNGFDLTHFPCKKLLANNAYGVIATLAYNILRYASFFLEKNGCFSKKTRNKLLFIGCQLVKHARSFTIKINNETKEFLNRILQNIHSKFSRYRLSS